MPIPLAAAFTVLLLFASPGRALDPADKCEAAKNKVAGKYAFCRQSAEAKAIKKGVAPDYSRCDAKFGDKWGTAEAKGGADCPTTGDEASMRTFITAHTDAVSAKLARMTKRVFVTATSYGGDLGGLAGGDSKCQAAADAVLLGGTWTAWLSDSSVDARDRITDAKYRLVDGTTIVASSLLDLTDGSIQHPIDQDEKGESPGDSGDEKFVWTGTLQDGTDQPWYYGFSWDCDGWGGGSELAVVGQWCADPSRPGAWTADFPVLDCDESARLYCFED